MFSRHRQPLQLRIYPLPKPHHLLKALSPLCRSLALALPNVADSKESLSSCPDQHLYFLDLEVQALAPVRYRCSSPRCLSCGAHLPRLLRSWIPSRYHRKSGIIMIRRIRSGRLLGATIRLIRRIDHILKAFRAASITLRYTTRWLSRSPIFSRSSLNEVDFWLSLRTHLLPILSAQRSTKCPCPTSQVLLNCWTTPTPFKNSTLMQTRTKGDLLRLHRLIGLNGILRLRYFPKSGSLHQAHLRVLFVK